MIFKSYRREHFSYAGMTLIVEDVDHSRNPGMETTTVKVEAGDGTVFYEYDLDPFKGEWEDDTYGTVHVSGGVA